MTYPRLNLLDDSGAVVFRLNSVTEGVPQTLQTILDPDNFDLAAPDYDPEIFFGEGSFIGTLTRAQEQTALMTFRVWCRASSVLVYRQEVGRVTELLRKGGTLEWILGPGADEVRYIDLLTLAEIPQPFRSEFGVRHIVMGGYDMGFEVSLIRQGYLRGPLVESTPVEVSNDPAHATLAGRAISASILGDAPTPVTVRVTTDDTNSIRRYGLWRRTKASQATYLSTTRYAQCEATGNGWTVTLENDTIINSEPAGLASGNSTAMTIFATDPSVWKRRVRLERSADVDSLVGRWDVYARISTAPTGGSPTPDFDVRLRWAPSLANPAIYVNEEKALRPRISLGSGSNSYADVNLGQLVVPPDASGLALELWARRTAGSVVENAVRWDFIFLVPADEPAGIVSVPAGSKQTWLGSELLTPTNPGGLSAGTVSGTRLVLDATNQAGGTPPNTGLVVPTGRHRITFRGGGNPDSVVALRVRNITDSLTVIAESVTTGFPHRLSFDAEAGKAYQYQVVKTNSVDKTNVNSIEDEFLPAINPDESGETDPESGSATRLDSSGNPIDSLETAGMTPMRMEPGENVLILFPGLANINVGRDGSVAGGEITDGSVLSHTATVTLSYFPRYRQ